MTDRKGASITGTTDGPRPRPRDVRDALNESLDYLGRIRGWSHALAASPPELAPPSPSPKDPLGMAEVRRLQELLATRTPSRMAQAAGVLERGAAAMSAEREEVDRLVRRIVELAHAQYGERLVAHARRALRCRDDDPRVEDVVADAWLAFIVNLPNFSGRCGIYTYLLTILDHLLIRRGVDYAKRCRDKALGQDLEAGELELAAPSPEPLGDLETQEDKEHMARALMGVALKSPLQFQRLCLYYLLGLEARRIADIEGRQPGGIAKGLFDARAALRDHLDRGGPAASSIGSKGRS